MIENIFWACMLLIFYSYAGYPLLLWFISCIREMPVVVKRHFTPPISVIVPVHNEQHVIASKLENLLSLTYPREKLEIIVVSDGSRDRTAEIVGSFLDRGVRFFELSERTGKAGALNLGLRQASGEIIVFTDASIMLEPDSLSELAQPFHDPGVGCVSGEDYIKGQSGEGLYGRYELFLRYLESRIGSLVAASGCFYAQRRELISEFKSGMAPDFFSVLETVANGRRAVSCPTAKGFMGAVKSAGGEFQRKSRTLLRGITTLMAFKYLLNPLKYGLFAWSLWTHKVLRWLCGMLLIVIFLTNLQLVQSPFYLAIFVLQTGFYSMAFIGLLTSENFREKLLIKIPLFFCVTNFSTVLAWFKYLKGERQEIWEPSKR
jgi:cellulose synthase/poly-beta-1,6-N-acetylglucosamine synthase-like glycosyltransferase